MVATAPAVDDTEQKAGCKTSRYIPSCSRKSAFDPLIVKQTLGRTTQLQAKRMPRGAVQGLDIKFALQVGQSFVTAQCTVAVLTKPALSAIPLLER